MVLCYGGRDLVDCECRLAHVEPGGGPLQPKPRQAQAGADRCKHDFVTWKAGVTLVPSVGGGALRRVEVEGSRVQGLEQGRWLGHLGRSTRGGSVRQRHAGVEGWSLKKLFADAGKQRVLRGV